MPVASILLEGGSLRVAFREPAHGTCRCAWDLLPLGGGGKGSRVYPSEAGGRDGEEYNEASISICNTKIRLRHPVGKWSYIARHSGAEPIVQVSV